MPVKTVTTAGTRVQLVPNTTTATQRYCARLIIVWINGQTNTVFIGLAAPNGVSNTVSSTVYDHALNANKRELILGSGNSGKNDVDAGSVWLDAAVNGEGVSYYMDIV